jgi:hypothetical protein
MSVTPAWFMASPDRTVALTGTSLRNSSRFVAVTTTSSSVENCGGMRAVECTTGLSAGGGTTLKSLTVRLFRKTKSIPVPDSKRISALGGDSPAGAD